VQELIHDPALMLQRRVNLLPIERNAEKGRR